MKFKNGQSGIGSVGPRSSFQVKCTLCNKILGYNELARVSKGHKSGHRIRCPFCRKFDCIDTPVEAIELLVQTLEVQNSFNSAWSNPPVSPQIKVCPVCGEEGSATWWWEHTSNGYVCKTTGHAIPLELRDNIEITETPRMLSFNSEFNRIKKQYEKSKSEAQAETTDGTGDAI